MTSIQTSVCIVGGGPAGLLLGLLLAKRDVDVIVLEGHETFHREFRGEVLQPSTAHLLDELGLLEYILAQPHSTLNEGLVRINGATAGKFAFDNIVPEYPYAIWMPQPIFLQALVDKATPLPSFQCWMGARVRDLIEADGTIVGVRGTRHGKEPLRSGLTLSWVPTDAIQRYGASASLRSNTSTTTLILSGLSSSSPRTGRIRYTSR